MKKTLQIALLVMLLFPVAVSAAWWNPLTWSWSSSPTSISIPEDTQGVDIPDTTNTENVPIVDTPQVTIKYVDNPNQAIQIQELMKENRALNTQMAVLQTANTSLSGQLAQCKAPVAKAGAVGGVEVNGTILSPCDQAKDALDSDNLTVFNATTNYNNKMIELKAQGASVAEKDALYPMYFTDDVSAAKSDVSTQNARIKQYCKS